MKQRAASREQQADVNQICTSSSLVYLDVPLTAVKSRPMARTVSDTRPPLARIASYGVGAGGLTTS